MIRAKDLKALLKQIPDDARIVAYDGHGIGLLIFHNDAYGWIPTGDNMYRAFPSGQDDADINDIVNTAGQDSTILDEVKAALYLDTSPLVLTARRNEGIGPLFSKNEAGQITYSAKDLEAWLQAMEKRRGL